MGEGDIQMLAKGPRGVQKEALGEGPAMELAGPVSPPLGIWCSYPGIVHFRSLPVCGTVLRCSRVQYTQTPEHSALHSDPVSYFSCASGRSRQRAKPVFVSYMREAR